MLLNENDPFAAAWLDALVAEGHITGHVDRRSIADLVPADCTPTSHFFAGIGGWPHALTLARWPISVPIWTGSCPCQPFSQAGKRGGDGDPRHLWPKWLPLIRECRPAIIVGEQVASGVALEWLDAVFDDLEGEGYACAAADLCAASVGAPHKRQRLYWVAHAESNGRSEGRAASGRASGKDREGPGDGGGVGDADRSATRQLAGELRRDEGEHDERPARGDHGAGATGDDGNPWSNPDWIPCRVPGSDGSGSRGTVRAPGRTAVEPDRPGAGSGGGMGNPHGQHATQERAGARDISQERQAIGWRTEQFSRSGTAGRNSGGDSPEGAGGRGRGNARATGDDPRNPWSNPDWIPCRVPGSDEVIWRPVEPGTFPLASRIPGRVGMLRGYGNSIVPQVAAAFIEAVMAELGIQQG